MLTVLAFMGIGLYFVLTWMGVETDPTMSRELTVGVPLVVGAYFIAAPIGAVGYYLLGSLRPGLLGWVLTGMWIAFAAYGTIAVVGAIGYVYFDVSLMEFETADEAWTLTKWSTIVLTLLAGIPGGIYGWYRHREGRHVS